MLTFRNLLPVGEPRGKVTLVRCSALQPNRMQCVKGGTWEVTDDSTETPTVRQYCTAHTKQLEYDQQQHPERYPSFTQTKAGSTGTYTPGPAGQQETITRIEQNDSKPAEEVKPEEPKSEENPTGTEQNEQPKPDSTSTTTTVKPPISPK